MVGAILGLEEEMWSWRADTLQSDEMDRGRAALRTMVSELGAVAEAGTRDPATVVGPFVDLALALRADARTGGRYADADAVRDRLVALGVEVRDTSDGRLVGPLRPGFPALSDARRSRPAQGGSRDGPDNLRLP